ncbi:hypothetical protein IE53DRAFT_383601 [Violaceomyces palustris]|uniref:Uncharacterized protein n=1 Tax=Violaceomyces palustris TaxID=1673888 RepID=A0ACD0P6S9_9BASI|nr:hypothetical protein IE53DRAFT_383601 [Violaceomyces palustris]
MPAGPSLPAAALRRVEHRSINLHKIQARRETAQSGFETRRETTSPGGRRKKNDHPGTRTQNRSFPYGSQDPARRRES